MKPILTVITLCLTLFTTLIALDAHADWGRHGGGWRGPRGPGYGYTPPNVTCSASDNGWEEHFFGHSTCDDCKRKHGRCTERCSQTNYNCRAEGTGWGDRRESVEAYSGAEYQARNEALNRCYNRGLRNCIVVDCNSSSQVVSTRDCR